MYNSTYSAAGYEDTGDGGFFNGVADFAMYGVTSSLLSGVTSIANTGISFANLVSGGDYEQLDAGKTLESAGLGKTADYYAEHKGAMDTIGFVATAFIPGLVGIKAARAAISLGASRNIKFVAGLADVVDNSKRAAAIGDIARSGVQASAFTARNQLIAKGYAVNAIEGLAAEAAIAVTMNQNPILEPQTTNYLDGLAAYGAGNLLLGAGFGGVIGGAITHAGIASQVKRLATDFVKGVNTKAGIAATGELNILAGDEITRSQRQLEGFQARVDNLDTVEAQKAGTKNLEQQVKIREAALNKATRNDPVVTQQLTAFLDSADMNYEAKAKLFSGVKSATTPYKNEQLFTVPSIQMIADVTEEQALAQIAGIYEKLPAFKGWDKAQISKYVADRITPVMRTSYGFADRTGGAKYAYIDTAKSRASLGNNPIRFDDDALDFVYAQGGDEAVMATIMHEKGHLTADWLSSHSMKSSKFGQKVTEELKQLSRVARPEDWSLVDRFQKMIDEGTLPDDLRQRADAHIRYMNNPRELWADSFQVMENPELADVTRKMAPSAAKLALRERSLSQRFTDMKRVLNVNTKEITRSGFAFNAADHGVKAGGFKNNKTAYLVELDGGKYVTNVMDKFNPETAAPRDAAAHIWAWMRPDSELKVASNVALDTVEIPKMTRALKDMQQAEASGQFLSFKVKKLDGTEVELTSADELALHLREVKQDAVLKLSGKTILDTDTDLPRALTHYEIGRVLDTSPEFALGQFNANAFDSLVNDVTKPQHIVLRYDRKAVKSFEHMSAEAAALSRIEVAKAHADSLFSDVFKDGAMAFPERVRQSPTAQASVMTDISQFEGGSGIVMQANGEYLTGAGAAQATGMMLNTHQMRFRETLNKAFEPMKVAITSNPKAMAEFNVFDAWHRGHKAVYRFADADNPVKQFEELSNAAKAITDPVQLAQLAEPLAAAKAQAQGILDAGLGEWFSKANSRYMSDAAYGELRTLVSKEGVGAEDWTAWYSRHVGEKIKGSNVIDVANPEVDNFLTAHVQRNDELTKQRKRINNAKGKVGREAAGRVYLGPADTARTPYHAYVVSGNEGIGSTKEVGVVMAMDAGGLQTKIAQIQQKFGDSVKVVTESDREAFLRARKDWDATKRHGDLLVDSDLQRMGILSDVLPELDPTAVQRAIDALGNLGTGNMRDVTALKYAEEIAELRAYGREAAMANMSRFGATKANTKAGDSWAEQERIMLNLSASHSDSKWLDFQQHIDSAATKVFNKIGDAFEAAKKTGYADSDIERLDQAMKQYGYKGPMDPSNPAVRDLFVTGGKQHRGSLTKLSTALNGLLATTMLRLDAANWIVNAMSMPITAAPELRMLSKMITADGQAKMAALGNVVVPGTKHTMPTSAKVLLQATKEFLTDRGMVQRYIDMGIIPKDVASMLRGADEINGPIGELFGANAGTMGGAIDSVMRGIKKVGATYMKGSDFAEQFNFAVAARSAEIMIEASGAKLGDGMKRAMMNRFATRVNGNYAAAQRPVLFQGFAGQAIGLFQTYSLNMMNNMFRYVGADKRTALTMLGLQAGVFGAGSIPGFKLLNEKVLKDTNGNTDLYQETSNIAGDELGSWMLYGLGSNLTGMGLYSRGNIAPQLATVIPTSVQELPVVKAGAKTVGAVLDLASNLGSGMDAGQAFATALASQGMSRPLQGVGVLYNGEVASTKGNKLYDVDLLNFTSTAARLMGSKSLKDSVMQDAYYRMQKYRSAAEEDAIEAFKPIDASIRMGNGVTDEMISNAFEAYTARGRTYDAFSRKLQQTMMLGSQGELMQMREKITSPEGQYMARVLADSE